MPPSPRRVVIVRAAVVLLLTAAAVASSSSAASAFQPTTSPPSNPLATRYRSSFRSVRLNSEAARHSGDGSDSSTVAESAVDVTDSSEWRREERPNRDGAKRCCYKFEGRWRQRLNLKDLEVGQKLEGRKLEGCDLLDGVTGPKVFFECGVGRTDPSGNWHIVSGMLRLGKRGAKKSVTRKRVARLADKVVDLYVSEVRLDNGMLEVSTSAEQVEEMMEKRKSGDALTRVPVSTLMVGQELVGTVTRVEPYGVHVDVGANRNGLLHIKTVKKLFRKYINKEEGLIEAGLEHGAKIRVAVLSNERKRLALDFTDDVRESAAEARKVMMQEREKKRAEEQREKDEAAGAKVAVMKKGGSTVISVSNDGTYSVPDEYADISEHDAAAWAAYGAGDDSGVMAEDEAAEWAAFAAGDEHYDEDDDIEDALGISTY